MRSLDFTACTRNCAVECWRKLTDEEKDWLEKNPNRQSYGSFDNCEYFEEVQEKIKEKINARI